MMLVGPKDAYPLPDNHTGYRFRFRVQYLEDRSGSPPASDSYHSTSQVFSMGYATTDSKKKEIVFSGTVQESFIHDAKRLNLRNHGHGLGFYMKPTNLNESLLGTIFFRSEFNSQQVKTLWTEGYNTEDGILRIKGSSPVFSWGVPMRLDVELREMNKNTWYVSSAELYINQEYMDEFIAICADKTSQ